MARKTLLSERAQREELKEQGPWRKLEVGIPAPPSLRDMIREAVFTMGQRAAAHGQESFAEADDFDVSDDLDDLDFRSKYEFTELRPEEGQVRDDEDGERDAPLSEYETALLAKLQSRQEKHSAPGRDVIDGELESEPPPKKPASGES